MKPLALVLYAESRFTPWKENIDIDTVKWFSASIPEEYETAIVHMVEPSAELLELLLQADIVFNLCYGFGAYSQAEVAAWLDNGQVNHLSSGATAQLNAQDKMFVGDLCFEQNIKSPETIRLLSEDKYEKYIVKPRFGGCHRNISIFTYQELKDIFHTIDPLEYVVQPYIKGREFSVGVLPKTNGTGYETLTPVEIKPFPPRDLYVAGSSFGTTVREFNPDLDENLDDNLRNIALKVHNLLGLKYFSRVDFRVANGVCYVLDVNTMPNMHPQKSLIPAMLQNDHMPLNDFIVRLIELNKRISSVNLTKLNAHVLN